jgi:ABC-type multidrug transport system fused ATPase/permease subunit
LANLYPVFALASIITFLSKYKTGDPLNYIWLLLSLWLIAVIIRNLSQYFSKFLGFWVAEKIAIDSALKTVRHLFLLDMAWHERENSGNKIKRIQNAGDGLNKIVRLWFDSIIEIIVNLVAINIIIARFDHTVLLTLFGFLLTYFIFSFFITRRAGVASYIVNEQEENVNGLLFEAINNIKTVKVMSMAQTLHSIIIIGTDLLIEKIKTRIKWFQFRNAFLSGLAATFRIGIIFLIVQGVRYGHYEVGFLILFNGYFSDLRESIDELSTATQDFVTSKFSVARMKDILNEPVTIDNENDKVSFPDDWKKITVKNLSFSYGENKVLNKISFEVNRGEKVGIVGLSGAGKSTLFKLLLKERQEFNGDILFDDLSIKQIRTSDYFKFVSVVLQDTEVFNFSLRENITITNAKEKNNQRLLKQALATAHISEFLHKLPEGLDTIIGEKGVKLSGGERQRLGIARAIFKEPQILMLDEATSHLDLESEEKIRDSLHKFFENVTAIVIAHRLTTIKEMDKILVIENGKIIESGNFNKLYSDKGRFYELWEKQKL